VEIPDEDAPDPTGEWFRRVIAKPGAVVNALHDGHSAMRRMEQKAVWMVERQREIGGGD
jgi:hypothetical protein